MNIKSKAFLAYVIIFLLGGATGFFLNGAVGPRFHGEDFDRRPELTDAPPLSNDGEIPPRMRDFIIDKLDLQENQIEPFFEVQAKHFQTFLDSVREYQNEERAVFRELYADFIDDADEILSEQQIQELNRFAHPDSVHQRRMQRRERGRRFR